MPHIAHAEGVEGDGVFNAVPQSDNVVACSVGVEIHFDVKQVFAAVGGQLVVDVA